MARRPRGSIVNRRHLARQQREDIQKKYIQISAITIVALVVVLVIAGLVYDRYIVARQPVATVNGDEISTREFQARVKYERSNLVSQYQSTAQNALTFGTDPQFVGFFQNSLNQIELQLEPPDTLGRNVLNLLIEDRIIRQKAAEMGITVTQEEVQKALEESFGYFGGEQAPTPTAAPTSRATSTLTALQMTLTAPTATPTLTATVSLTETLEATPTAEFTSTSEPTEAADLPTPTATVPIPTPTPYSLESYQIDYQTTVSNWANIGFTEEDLRYLVEGFLIRQKLLDAITTDVQHEEEQVWARHILVQDEVTADEIYARLVAGEDFAKLAAEFSTDTSNASSGGDLDWFGLGAMVPEFEAVAFNTPIGEISVPVQSTFGWHIIQVLGHETRDLTESEFEQKRQEFFQEWLGEQRQSLEPNTEIFDYWADRVPNEPSVQHIDLQSIIQQTLPETIPTPGE
jgi:peptidyl-prolyl cis-trans isomerase D